MPSIIELKTIPVNDAKNLIVNHVKTHPNSWTSEIAEALGIDYIITNEALQQLKKDGILKSK